MSFPHRTDLPPVRTAGELTDRWRLVAVDEQARPADRADLWVQLFDAGGLQCPPMVVVEGVPVHPEGPFTAHLAGVLAHLLEEDAAGTGAVAFAFSRTLPTEVQASDLEWADALLASCADEGIDVLGVHLVTGSDVRCVV